MPTLFIAHALRRHAASALLGVLAGLVLAAAAATLGAQPARVAAGVTAASFTWDDGRREHALATLLQLAPRPWLVLGAVPTLLRAESFGDAPARVGPGDTPVFAGATRGLPLPLRPQLGVAANVTLPTGDVARGLGRGEALVSGEGTLALTVLPTLTVRGGGAHLLRDGGLLPEGAPRTTAFADAVVGLGERTNASVGMTAEIGDAARSPWEPARTLNAALVRTLAGSTAIVVGAGHSLRGPGPTWSLSLGLGTAFGGVSPVGASSVRGRAPAGTTPLAGGPLAPLATPSSGCGLLGC